jgi:hypothetical protein
MEGWNQGSVQEDSGESKVSIRQRSDEPLRAGELIQQTYRRCRERFEEYFPLIVGASIVGYAACYGLEYIKGSIRPEIAPHSVFDTHPAYATYLPWWLKVWLLRCLQVLAVWIVATLTFASVALKVLGETRAPAGERVRATDALRSAATHHLRGIVRVVLLGTVSTVFYYNFLASWLVRPIDGLLISLGQFDLARSSMGLARGLVLVVFGLLVSATAPAIPSLMDDSERTLRNAVDIGLKSTAGHRGILCLWLGTCAAVGALVYFMGTSVLESACRGGEIPPAACPLLPAVFYVVLTAVLAGPPLIWFSLLYASLHSPVKGLSAPAAAD